MEITGELEQLVAGARVEELFSLLEGLDDEGLATARAWYRGTGWALARGPDELSMKFLGRRRRRSCALALALVLSTTPRDAVRRCDWNRFDVGARRRDMPALVGLTAIRGAEWCGEFVALASSARLAIWATGVQEITCLALPLVAEFSLPVPAGEQYARGWVGMAPGGVTRGLGAGSECDFTAIRLRRATAHYVDDARTSLLSYLQATPRVQDTLVAVLGTRNLLGLLDLSPRSHDDDDWGLAEGELKDVLDALARAGTLDPDVLFRETVDALGQAPNQSTVTAGLALLEALGLLPERIRTHAATLVGAMPMLPGRAVSVLLPPLLAGGLADADLGDLGATILSRPEKAPKAVLVRFLAALPGPSAAADDLLASAAMSEDTAFAARARSALVNRGGADVTREEPAAGGRFHLPWSGVETTFRARPFPAVEPTAAGLQAWLQEAATCPSITSQASLLDAVIRFAAHDLAGLRRAVRGLPSTFHYSDVPGYAALKHWGDTGASRPPRRDWDDRPAGWRRLEDGLTEEVLDSLGGKTSLLSTPTRGDGVLEWGDFLARIQAMAAGERVGEWDLVRALLRLELPVGVRTLEPPAVAERAMVGGRTLSDILQRWVACGGLPMRSPSKQTYRYLPEEDSYAYDELCPVPDAGATELLLQSGKPEARAGGVEVALTHRWVLESRVFETSAEAQESELGPVPVSAALPVPVPGRRRDRERFEPDGTILIREGYGRPRTEPGLRVDPCDLSAALDALDWVSPPIRKALKRLADPVGRHRFSIDADPAVQASLLGVTPFWVEVAAAGARLDRGSVATFRVWQHSAGPIGLAVHHRLACMLVDRDAGARSAAAAAVGALHGEARLEPALLTDTLLDLLAHRQLPLTRLASVVEQTAMAAGAAVVWPVLRAVLQEGCVLAPKPAGLADLLRAAKPVFSIATAHDSDVTLPPAVLALAASKSGSKAAVEARALGHPR